MGPPPRPKVPQNNERKGRCLINEKSGKTTNSTQAESPKPKATKVKHRTDQKQGLNLNPLLFLSVAVLALGAGVGVTYLLIQQWNMAETGQEQTTSTAESANPASPEVASNSVIVAPIRDSFRELKSAALQQLEDQATGTEVLLSNMSEVTGMANIRSFTMTASQDFGGRIFDVKIYAREPSSIRATTSDKTMKNTVLINGQAGQIIYYSHMANDSSSRELDNYQRVRTLLAYTPPLALWQMSSNIAAIEDGGIEFFNGAECQVILNEGITPYMIKHYIDPNTSLELGRSVDFVANGTPVTLTVVFEQYSRTGGVLMPQKIIIRDKIPSIQETVVDVSEWEFNPGLLNSLFKIENS